MHVGAALSATPDGAVCDTGTPTGTPPATPGGYAVTRGTGCCAHEAPVEPADDRQSASRPVTGTDDWKAFVRSRTPAEEAGLPNGAVATRSVAVALPARYGAGTSTTMSSRCCTAAAIWASSGL